MPRRRRPPPVDYLARTRELPVNIVFLVPFLVLYPLCLVASQSPVQNAAGAFFTSLATSLGPGALAAVSLLVAGLLLALLLLRVHQAPLDRGLYGGMLLEGLVYGAALGLISSVLARHLPLGRMVPLAGGVDTLRASVRDLGLAIGAGIFEEALFRGVVLLGSWVILRHAIGADRITAAILSIVLSAWLFSAWHHWGAGAEPYHAAVFRFRFAAGAVLGAIFLGRGLGIAAFAHGFYDALVLLDAP